MRRLQRRELLAQKRLGMAQRQVLLIAFRRYAYPSRKHPLEMRSTHPHFRRQRLKAQRFRSPVNQRNSAGNDAVMIGGSGIVGLMDHLCHGATICARCLARDPKPAHTFPP